MSDENKELKNESLENMQNTGEDLGEYSEPIKSKSELRAEEKARVQAEKEALKKAKLEEKQAEKNRKEQAKADALKAKAEAKQAKLDLKQAEKEKKIQAKNEAIKAKADAKQAKIEAKKAEKEKKIQAKNEAIKAKADAKQAKIEAKKAEKEKKIQDKNEAIKAKADAKQAKIDAKQAEKDKKIQEKAEKEKALKEEAERKNKEKVEKELAIKAEIEKRKQEEAKKKAELKEKKKSKSEEVQDKSKKKSRLLIAIGICMIVIVLSLIVLSSNTLSNASLSYNEFKADMESGYIDEIVLSPQSPLYIVFYKDSFGVTEYYDEETGEMVKYEIVDGRRKETLLNPNDEELLKSIAEHDITITILSNSGSDILKYGLSLLPTLLLMAFLLWFYKMQFKGGTNDNKKVVKKSDVKFSDVAGMAEEKEELLFAIKSLQNVEEYVKKGVKPVKGILLEGPPGVGKTMLAKAVAGEAGVNFFSYSGSDFVEMFVGLGARRVRSMFEQAEHSKPCVIFIDEIDALGRKRIAGGNGGTQEADQTLVALLERMDGLNSSSGILFIAATNRVDALDSALLRPGRFDKTIHITGPRTKEDRIEMVKVHSKDKVFAEGVTAEDVAKQCYGLTGAEIASALNDAVLESFKAEKGGIIDLSDIDKAIMKMYAKGLAKGRHSKMDLKRVAIHEVGHAIMNKKLDRAVVKVSVQPYSSGVGGVTQVDGESSGFDGLRTKTDIINDIKVCYAGKVAEEALLGECSIGASNDLEKATYLIRDYIGTFAMENDNLLALVPMSQDNLMIGANDVLLDKMNKKAVEIYSSVKEVFADKEVQEQVRKIAEYLEENEVIYDFDAIYSQVENGGEIIVEDKTDIDKLDGNKGCIIADSQPDYNAVSTPEIAVESEEKVSEVEDTDLKDKCLETDDKGLEEQVEESVELIEETTDAVVESDDTGEDIEFEFVENAEKNADNAEIVETTVDEVKSVEIVETVETVETVEEIETESEAESEAEAESIDVVDTNIIEIEVSENVENDDTKNSGENIEKEQADEVIADFKTSEEGLRALSGVLEQVEKNKNDKEITEILEETKQFNDDEVADIQVSAEEIVEESKKEVKEEHTVKEEEHTVEEPKVNKARVRKKMFGNMGADNDSIIGK